MKQIDSLFLALPELRLHRPPPVSRDCTAGHSLEVALMNCTCQALGLHAPDRSFAPEHKSCHFKQQKLGPSSLSPDWYPPCQLLHLVQIFSAIKRVFCLSSTVTIK